MRYIACTCLLLGCAPETETIPSSRPTGAAARIGDVWGGCGDVTLYASNARNRKAVFLNASGLAEAAWQHGGPQTHRYTLPSSDLTVYAETGRRLTSTTCVGIPPIHGPRVDAVWDVVSGTAKLRVEPDTNSIEPAAFVRVTLDDVVFEDSVTHDQFTVHHQVSGDISVGFYPP